MENSNTILTEQNFGLLWILGWGVFFLLIYVIKSWNRKKKLELIHKERMAALEKGIPLLELPDYETLPTKSQWSESLRLYLTTNPRMPLGLGAICIMLGIGISLSFFLSQNEDDQKNWSSGLIVIFLGLGLWLHYFLTKGTTK